MEWVFDDGGRAAAGFKGHTRDCVCRAIAIATQRPYKEIYNLINQFAKGERKTAHKGKSSARTGVYKQTVRKVMEHLCWVWHPTMQIGQGCTTHLRDGELPSVGRYIVTVSGHETALVDGVIHDTFDPSRGGDRCVYGYYSER